MTFYKTKSPGGEPSRGLQVQGRGGMTTKGQGIWGMTEVFHVLIAVVVTQLSAFVNTLKIAR